MTRTAKTNTDVNPAPKALRMAAFAVMAACITVVSTCSPRQSLVDEIRASGTLKVATVNSPTTYYLGPDGEPTGFEYDLVSELAQLIGVKLELVLASTPPEAIQMALSGKAQMAAAGIGVNPERSAEIRFGTPLHEVVPLLVYRNGTPKPSSLGDLKGTLAVVDGGIHAQRLRELRTAEFPNLSWQEIPDVESEELLFRVSSGDLDYTIANSDLLAINQRYYPNLRVAFQVAESQPLAWAFPANRDDSLYQLANEYIGQLEKSELSRLRDRYFGHIDQVDSYGALTLANDVESRLPRYRAQFEKVAEKVGLDWRLLAAIGYQESHWDPSATSPTGVRGIMQLTNATASLMKIDNRDDPAQSISGGARYFRMLLDQLPPEVREPDRTWLALAAYNIGYGHLLDARTLVRQQGGDPDRWLDIRERLPLLTQSRWHSKTKYGYARGHEAVTYVGNVRTYYDMLVWMTGVPVTPPQPATPAVEAPQQNDTKNPLGIDSPIL
ncbi:membrane-bound lytic murein transglycosylase MltF [Sinimarinibacterium sp. CAU 1509]|uniref:membrane-bound lytic murein transglycosylase MltF n=1 Tax=Sinimarinibacterium sp. CAU 1509 TaxID=2562283 RepID=UPI0010AD2CE6|nr:membrane-bound lytic murein transglycosylase MltF [Sinimarinibacterium sp. CAU 1509]TJY65184.1 membrane-bound lytic murein transglycosylase MltF [Sinimarinibacterium sp. CAU 1509]